MKEQLNSQLNNYTLKVIDVLPSTNDYLKEHYQTLSSNTFIQTNFQTKGRGQFERIWESNKGENILISWLIKEETNVLGLKMRVKDILIEWFKDFNVNASYKYPNDIYVLDKKIAGILIETKVSTKLEYLIVGIGININQQSFNDSRAVSLKQLTNQSYQVDKITKKLINMLI